MLSAVLGLWPFVDQEPKDANMGAVDIILIVLSLALVGLVIVKLKGG